MQLSYSEIVAVAHEVCVWLRIDVNKILSSGPSAKPPNPPSVHVDVKMSSGDAVRSQSMSVSSAPREFLTTGARTP